MLVQTTPAPTTAAPAPTAGAPAAAPAKQIEIPGMPATGTATTSAAPVVPTPGGAPAKPATPDLTFILLIAGVFIFLFLTSILGGRKEKKKRAELLSGLGRNDRVQTIGGILGTVVELRDDEVTLRVDENTNTRITFSKSSVQQILRKANAPATPSQAEAKPAGIKAGV